jgi:hypothetical protein
MPNVNNRPRCENWPNLVTLTSSCHRFQTVASNQLIEEPRGSLCCKKHRFEGLSAWSSGHRRPSNTSDLVSNPDLFPVTFIWSYQSGQSGLLDKNVPRWSHRSKLLFPLPPFRTYAEVPDTASSSMASKRINLLRRAEALLTFKSFDHDFNSDLTNRPGAHSTNKGKT